MVSLDGITMIVFYNSGLIREEASLVRDNLVIFYQSDLIREMAFLERDHLIVFYYISYISSSKI